GCVRELGCGPFQGTEVRRSGFRLQEGNCFESEVARSAAESWLGRVQAGTLRRGHSSPDGRVESGTKEHAGADAAGPQLLWRQALRGSRRAPQNRGEVRPGQHGASSGPGAKLLVGQAVFLCAGRVSPDSGTEPGFRGRPRAERRSTGRAGKDARFYRRVSGG